MGKIKLLVLVYLGLVGIAGITAVLTDRDPKVKATVPNLKYSAPAISTTTVHNAQDFTVLISNESMGSVSRGTGILLDSTHVLTCAHLMPYSGNGADMWVFPYPGSAVVHAKIKFVSQPNDLMLLELTTPVLGHKHATIQPNVELGEPIIVVGNLEGYMKWFVSYGIIGGEQRPWLLTDATIRGGNSGGPWVNARGEVVAITDVSWHDGKGIPTGVGGGVTGKRIARFLEESHHPTLFYVLTGE